jgi:NAD(P)-dependent dehydrogenase (short-subunit alcohol dehydrogenase family)
MLCHENGSYVIVGGNRGIGLDVASWLATKGACHLILVSRSGANSEEARTVIQDLTAQGVAVHECLCDVSSREDVDARLKDLLPRVPSVRGVIYGAMVLRVSRLKNNYPICKANQRSLGCSV